MIKNIAIISTSKNKEAEKIKNNLAKKYGFVLLDFDQPQNFSKADIIVALGGDGFMLHLLHFLKNLSKQKIINQQIPVYGINFGSVGFLMNAFDEKADLLTKIGEAIPSNIYPLKMIATNIEGKKFEKLAINEVSLLRQTSLSAKIKIEINKKVRISNLSCDGALVATAAGSTAYNFSVGGPIIPFGSDIIALTPISAFRPRHWKGAILPTNSKIKFTILDETQRMVSATADFNEIRNVKEVEIYEDKEQKFTILFDANHSLEERIITEQFL